MFAKSAGSTYPYYLILVDLFTKVASITAMRNILAGNMAKAIQKALKALPFRVEKLASLHVPVLSRKLLSL